MNQSRVKAYKRKVREFLDLNKERAHQGVPPVPVYPALQDVPLKIIKKVTREHWSLEEIANWGCWR